MIIKSYLLEKNNELFNYDQILFYGENFGLINDLKLKIKKYYQDSQIHIYDQNELIERKNYFFSEISNLSLFENRKIFFINNCNDKILQILKELDNLNDIKIFFFSDILDKKSKLRLLFENSKNFASVACYEDNELTLKRIIVEKLNNFTGLTTNVINQLIENSNMSRIKLNNELNKIVTFFLNKKIDTNQLDKILNLKENKTFSAVKDAAIDGNVISTNKMLNNISLESEKTAFYITLLNQQLLKIKEILILSKKQSLEKTINEIRPPIFWKNKPIILNHCKKWDLKKIRKALNEIYIIEVNIKSKSFLDKTVLIKKIIVDICSIANAA